MAKQTKKATTKKQPTKRRKVKVQTKGLGDAVETVTKATGIKKVVEKFTPEGKDCGCDERKKKYNQIPLRTKAVNCFTKEQYETWGNFQKERTLTLSPDQVRMLCTIYADITDRPYWQPCTGCSHRPFVNMIELLDKVYELY